MAIIRSANAEVQRDTVDGRLLAEAAPMPVLSLSKGRRNAGVGARSASEFP